MQRWWYNSESKNDGFEKIHKLKKSPSKKSDGVRKWKFSVMTANLDFNLYEKIAVTGSCDELGSWDSSQSILLNRDEGTLNGFRKKNMKFAHMTIYF